MRKSLSQVVCKGVHAVPCCPDTCAICHLFILRRLSLLDYYRPRLDCFDLHPIFNAHPLVDIGLLWDRHS